MNHPSRRRDRQISEWSYRQCGAPRQLALRSMRADRPFARRSQRSTGTFNESEDLVAVLNRVATMSDQQVRERYHQLLDRGRGNLSPLDRFELERIEARLDAEDRDPVLEARERQWQEERTKLLDSVEQLLAKLRGHPL